MFDQLKPLMKNGERYIVVEEGRPEYVLMRFADYAILTGGRRDVPAWPTDTHHAASEPRGGWERANIELEEVGVSEPAARAVGFGGPTPIADPTTIRLEDLPL